MEFGWPGKAFWWIVRAAACVRLPYAAFKEGLFSKTPLGG
jgi:hypothetical protein